MSPEHARHDEQLRSAFKRIDELTAFKDAIEKEIRKLNDAITKNKVDQLEFEKSIALQIVGMTTSFENSLGDAINKLRDDKITDLEENIARKEKFNFWLMTTVLGTIITAIITTYLAMQ